MSLHRIVFGKTCHLPLELEHRAFWTTRKLNFDFSTAGEARMLKFNELDEFQQFSYENDKIYKDQTKIWHDKKIMDKNLEAGDLVLLFNSRLRLFPGKLKSR